jgi:hypothetical protein
MRLRRNEFCPIHRSLFCCGRETLPKPRLVRLGVQRVEDPHHPRRYRELRSPAEMRKLLNRKVREQAGICAVCHEAFTDYNDIVPDHRNPKGMGGAWRDDHPDNIQATHWWCNGEKGSTRMARLRVPFYDCDTRLDAYVGSVISMAEDPAALSTARDFSASLREIFSLSSLTWSKWQSRSFLPFLHGHAQCPFTFLAAR